SEVVIFFNASLAEDFGRRMKQGGQLASKMRFASAQWGAMLKDGAWLRHAAHANRQAAKLAQGLRGLPGIGLLREPEVNSVFVELPPRVAIALQARWRFYRFYGENGYRLMCSWATRDEDVEAFLADAVAAVKDPSSPLFGSPVA
ncbi:MAG: threonine aldolase, partial [Opitutaceae bacterium]